MMEQSSRFLSLSGLSGILIGLYALIAASIAYYMIINSSVPLHSDMPFNLILLAVIILSLSLITVIWLTSRRARKSGKKIWNPGSRLMCINLAVPLISGGIFILIFVFRGIYSIVAPSCLIFYGLSLVNAAKFTHQEIFYMGLFQITIGIFAAIFPGLGLLFWVIGFGIIHIIYGIVMYFRYERNSESA